MKLIRIILVALALFAPIRAGWIYMTEFLEVDLCLDQGGSYDYKNMRCDFDQSHEYIPFSVRHPNHVQNAGIWLGGFSLILLGTFKTKKRSNQAIERYGKPRHKI